MLGAGGVTGAAVLSGVKMLLGSSSTAFPQQQGSVVHPVSRPDEQGGRHGRLPGAENNAAETGMTSVLTGSAYK